MGPALGPPLLNGLLVALSGALLWFLTTPSFPSQNFPHMGGVIANSKGTLDELGDAAQCPKVGGKTVRSSPLEHHLE